MSDLSYRRAGSGRVLGSAIALALAKSRKGLGIRLPKSGRIVAQVFIHVSSEHDGGRILHFARLDVPRKLDPHDFGARTTLLAVSGLVLAAQSCREDQDSDVKWGRGWLSGAGYNAAQPRSSEKNAASRAGQTPCTRWAVTIFLTKARKSETAANRALEEKQPLVFFAESGVSRESWWCEDPRSANLELEAAVGRGTSKYGFI